MATHDKVKSAEALALELSLINGAVESIVSELERHGERPWTVEGAKYVRDRLLTIETIIGQTRLDAERARWHALTHGANVCKTKWVLTIPLIDRADFEEHAEELVVEGVRGFAFPEAWGYVEKPEAIFRVDFEVEANERETYDYVQEVHSAVASWCPFGYTIERNEAT